MIPVACHEHAYAALFYFQKTCFYLPRSGVLSIKNSIKLAFLRFTLWRQNIKFLSSTATNGIIGYLANLAYN